MLARMTGKRKTRSRILCSFECCLSRLLKANGLQTAIYLENHILLVALGLEEESVIFIIGDILRLGKKKKYKVCSFGPDANNKLTKFAVWQNTLWCINQYAFGCLDFQLNCFRKQKEWNCLDVLRGYLRNISVYFAKAFWRTNISYVWSCNDLKGWQC